MQNVVGIGGVTRRGTTVATDMPVLVIGVAAACRNPRWVPKVPQGAPLRSEASPLNVKNRVNRFEFKTEEVLW
jgi:hypothetical protein